MVHLLITTPYKLSAIAKKELSYHTYFSKVMSPSMLELHADEHALIYLNIWSRIANKIYLVVQTGIARDFDTYFDLIAHIDRNKYICTGQPIHIKADVYQSVLHHTPSLQSVAKKAIVRHLTGHNNVHRSENNQQEALEVQIFVIQDQCYICLNSSGDALHKRGYRSQTGDAPLKENVAAALVLMSNWTYYLPFYDPCCGSGTLCLEAAMIAKHRAPGLMRRFAFESWAWWDHRILTQVKSQAYDRQILKDHLIIGSDIDPKVLQYAQHNMENLGLGDCVAREHKNCLTYQGMQMTGTMVSNPPYGQRLQSDQLDEIHRVLADIYLRNNISGACISGYQAAQRYFDADHFKYTDLSHGSQEVTLFQYRVHDHKITMNQQ